jgi:hypothetical protein
MKKFLMLMVIMLIGFSLIGAVKDTETLIVNFTVPAVHELKISATDATTVGAFNTATKVTDTTIDYEEMVSSGFFMLVKTNDRGGMKVQAKLEHLKAPSPVTTAIQYTLKSGTTTLGTSESVGTNYVELLDIPASVGNGLRVVSKPFLVELYSDPATASTNSVEASAVGAYSTTITFELITP